MTCLLTTASRRLGSLVVVLATLASGCEAPGVPADTPKPVAAAETTPIRSPKAETSQPDTWHLAHARLVDLTHAFDDKTIYWPTEKGFQFERGPAGFTDKGYYYAANRFTTAEHGGTHIDAPIHFYKDRDTADEIPLRRLIGPGAVVDVSAQCAENPDYQISLADLRNWETTHGESLGDRIVLLATGWSKRWPNRQEYLGTGAEGEPAVAQLHFPGLEPTAAQWLAVERRVRAVGIDTASIDYGQSTQFQSHVTLFQHNVPAMENVAALDSLPATGFDVLALPMKIRGGSGGPLRIVAVVPATEDAGQD